MLAKKIERNPLVLLVDDQPEILEIFSVMMARHGFECLTAQSGDEGIQKAIEHSPDIIILDFDMPKKDGGETLLDIKGHPKLKNIPVIFLSGLVSGEGSLNVDGAHYDALPKPFNIELVVAKIQQKLDVEPA